MKTIKLLTAFCLSAGIGMGVNAQIINATQSDLNLWGAPANTGLAIAPDQDIQAAVYDDGSGNYYIDWIESASASIVDSDGNAGDNPDVAYYANADVLIVGYENGGDLFVDEYYLTALWPTPDYALNATVYIGSGQDINVDISSQGRGILTWDNGGGDVFACSYQIGGIVGPDVHIDGGIQPDIVLFDDGSAAAITYIQGGPGGDIFIETMDYADLDAGNHSPINQWSYAPTDNYEFPRIASERNANFGGSPDNFTVVAQDYNLIPGSATVDAFFVTNGSTMNPQVLVNSAFANCYGDYPLPVVTYHRGRVRVAWSQEYYSGCSGLTQSSPNNTNDVFVRVFSPNGSPATNYREVNQYQSTFSSYSRTSIASEYDGGYLVTSANYHGGILFNDQGDLFWKGIFQGNASYIDEHNVITEQENNFSLAGSPVDQTIQVLSAADDLATFQLLDNAGRIVELKTISNEGNNYSIDISHLSGGTYLLNCASNAGNEVLRILQVTK